jgi:acetyltransferase
LRTFSWAQRNDIFPRGNRVAIISDSGGASSMMAKSSELYGLEVPEFTEKLQTQIHELIPPTASAINPIDLTFDTNFFNLFVKFPKMVAQSGEVDSIIVFGVFDFNQVVELIVKSGHVLDEKFKKFASTIEAAYIKPTKRLIKKSKIPIFYVGPMPLNHSIYKRFFKFDVPIFETWDEPTKCMSVLTQYSNFRAKMSKQLNI